MEDLKWILFILIGLWLVWFLTGGPSREEAKQGIFIKPPAPLDSGETYGKPSDIGPQFR